MFFVFFNNNTFLIRFSGPSLIIQHTLNLLFECSSNVWNYLFFIYHLLVLKIVNLETGLVGCFYEMKKYCYYFKFGLALRHNSEVKIRPNLVDNIVRNFISKHVKFIRLQTEEVLTYLTDFFPLITRTSENKSACAFDNWRIDENHRQNHRRKPSITIDENHR